MRGEGEPDLRFLCDPDQLSVIPASVHVGRNAGSVNASPGVDKQLCRPSQWPDRCKTFVEKPISPFPPNIQPESQEEVAKDARVIF